MRSAGRSSLRTCRRSARSCARRPRMITGSRRSWQGSYRATHSACRHWRTETMYLTRKHLSRRTLLRGAGVAVGLPLLDAMIPAGTALAKTDAAPKLRVGFFYMPHGAVMWNTKHGKAMDHWTPSGAGADFKLSPIMEPLEKYKKYVTSFGNLQN